MTSLRFDNRNHQLLLPFSVRIPARQAPRKYHFARLLVATALFFIAAIILTFLRSDIAIAQTTSYQLTLVQPGDPDFSILIDTYYPGLRSLPDYESIRPFLGLLRNDTASTAYAYAVVWDLHYADGAIKPISTYFVKRHWILTGEDRVLRSHDIRLLSPLFDLSSDEYRSNRDFVHAYPAFMFPRLGQADFVKAEIDGAVFAGGVFSGDNRTHLAERFESALNAEHDEGVVIQRYLRSHVPASIPGTLAVLDEDIRNGQDLKGSAPDSKVGESLNGTDLQSMYLFDRENEARRLRSLLLRSGVDELKRRADAMAQYHFERLQKIGVQ